MEENGNHPNRKMNVWLVSRERLRLLIRKTGQKLKQKLVLMDALRQNAIIHLHLMQNIIQST